ncbi:hypothetical protein JOD43_000564 [Pullulanibacillus pueri]|uniref:SCP2 domain-containing protein n=1 Tax=Pullulanibacillus pueri TaxID=1437324 RepID=A0A8J3EKG1_9BACL|nr:SCP2 sterol-binding domain-containing protein [Pullulanibacillus pueri]MBM7680405.1 hypothetical protein [Pullulanibacillus pueri]GGH75231.1 hypothetical protein GCM10007096_04250 [Pullulanibacillus pueri]
MLKEASKQFADTLTKKAVLQPLYKNRNIVVEIKDNEEQTWLCFKNGTCEVSDVKPEVVDISVYGPSQFVESLMNGSERLMLLESEGNLNIDGNLHHLLALESLFLLTGQQSSLVKH